MTGLLVALLLSQARGTPPPQTQRPGVIVQEAGVTKGRATVIDFASGATVTQSATTSTISIAGGPGGGAPTTAQYWTGAADATLSAEKNLGALATGLVLNTAGTPTAYAGATCAAPGFVRVLSASGAATCASLRLDQLVNPTGDTAFAYPSGTKMLWTFTGSTDEAFTVHGDGAFTGTGDLVHIHKSGTGAALGSDALHVEVDADTNMTGLRVTMSGSARQAISTVGKVDVTGTVTATNFSGPLAGNVTGDVIGTASGNSLLGHAHTTTEISGLDATADFTSGTLAGARGGGGAALPTCAGTDKLTADGTSWSCAVDQTGAGGSVDLRGIPTVFGGF